MQVNLIRSATAMLLFLFYGVDYSFLLSQVFYFLFALRKISRSQRCEWGIFIFISLKRSEISNDRRYDGLLPFHIFASETRSIFTSVVDRVRQIVLTNECSFVSLKSALLFLRDWYNADWIGRLKKRKMGKCLTRK